MLGHAVQAEPGPQHAGGLGQLRGVHDAIGAARLGGGREAKLTLHLQPLHGARDGALADAVGAGQFGLRSEAEQGEAGQTEIAL